MAMVQPTELTPAVSPLRTYDKMQQNYFGPLSGNADPAIQSIDDPAFQQVATDLQALQQSHALLNGQLPPDPASVLARSAAHMTPGQIAQQVGQQTVNDMVTQPFHDFIDTWKRDWKTGLMETLGGAAVIGGVIGLEALTAGAATPWIFAAGAALVAPGMVKSWADEVQNPTDSNLVKALVSTSTGVLSVGTPTKGMSGLASSRRLLDEMLGRSNELHDVQDAASLIISGKSREVGRKLIRNDLPVEKQLETLANRPDDLRAQFERLGMPVNDQGVKDLLARSETADQMRSNAQMLRDSGDEEAAVNLEKELKGYLAGDVIPARLKVANDWLFLPNRPYQHVDIGEAIDADPLHAEARDMHTAAILGRLRTVGAGHGFTEANFPVKGVVEAFARNRAGDTRGGINQILGHWTEMVKKLGLSEAEVEQTLQGVEEPAIWSELSAPQKLLGQGWVKMQNVATANELKRGTISTALMGAVPRFFKGVGEGGTGPVVSEQMLSWLKGANISRSRLYQMASDLLNEDPDFKPAQLRSELHSRLGPDQQATFAETEPLRAAHNAHGEEIAIGRKRLAGLKGAQTRVQSLLARAGTAEEKAKLAERLSTRGEAIAQHLEDFKSSLGDSEHADSAMALLQHTPKERSAFLRTRPPSKQLVVGSDTIRLWAAGHMMRVNQADFGDALRLHAHLGVQALKDMANMPKWGIGDRVNFAVTPEAKAAGHELPTVLPENAFKGPGHPSRIAEQHGYFPIHPAIGRSTDLHYQPALYARDETAKQILKALDAVTDVDVHNGLLGALYKTANLQRAVTFLTPFWHAMNVGGRAISFFLNDPAIAGASAKALIHYKLHDPEAYARLDEEWNMAGGNGADHFHVGNHLKILSKERTGQPEWSGMMRTVEGPLDHYMDSVAERGFWNTVKDFQLMAYAYAKHTLRERLGPDHPEVEVRALAAEYANNLGGMVNPLYMSKLYKHVRGLVWFAPSYWATFLRSMSATMPGSDRLSKFLANKSEGRFVRFGTVPLRTVSDVGRKELARSMRSWALTYMMSGFAAADMMNVVFGGKHLWDNEQGHKFDVNVDKLVPPATTAGGATQETYLTGIPFFKQSADIANMMGLGHDWGVPHLLNDQSFKNQDVAHKSSMLAGAAVDGARRTLATKASGVAQAGYGLATGESASARFGQDTKQTIKGPIGRFDALLNLVPSGNVVERLLSSQQDIAERYPPGSPQAQAAQQRAPGLKDVASSLFAQYTGFPSWHHMGPEQPGIDDDRMTAWYKERNTIHDAMANYSKSMFAGGITPLEYQRHKQDLLTRMSQLDADTFGPSSPGGSLAGLRRQLSDAYGLNAPGLSTDDWFQRYESFSIAWTQTLSNASPSARSAWWEIDTAQWTDADYLHWQASQLRDALIASVDGVGGAHIRAYQSQIGPLLALPITTAQKQQLEQGDPYYYTYRQLLKQMSRNSTLGAFVSAFSSPFSQTRITPAGMTPADVQALRDAAPTGTAVVTPEEAQAQAQQARQLAHSPEVGQEGGSALASPTFDEQANQQVAQASADAQTGG